MISNPARNPLRDVTQTARRSCRAAMAVLMLAAGVQVRAADFVWTNVANGNWTAVTNWNPNGVPGASDVAYITNAGSYAVTLNASVEVAGLVLGGGAGLQRLTNSASGNTLTLSGPARVAPGAVMGWNAGTITGSGDLLVQGQLLWNGGTLGGLGTLVVDGAGSLSVGGSAVKTLAGRNLVNRGRVEWSGTGNLTFNLGTITNEPAGVVDILNNQTVQDLDGAGTVPRLVNLGRVRKTTGVTTTTFSGTTIDSAGEWIIEGGTCTVSSTFNNSGSVQVVQGTFNLNGGGSHQGTFDAGIQGTVVFGGGTHAVAGGVRLLGAGVHRLSGASTALNLAGTVEAERFEVAAGSLGGAGDLVVSNAFNWTGGTLAGTGTLLMPAGSSNGISGTAAKTLTGRLLDIVGTVTWTGTGDIQFNSGTLTVKPEGVFDIQNDELLTDPDAVNTPAVFQNQGTLRKSGGSATTTFTGITLNNAGTVDVQSGTLNLGNGSSAGSFAASTAGAILAFTAGTHTLQDGVALVGPGTHRVNGSGALLLVEGVVGAQRFELVQGTLGGAGTLGVSNAFTWSGGTQTGAGATELLAGSTVTLQGTAAKILTGRTVRNRGSCTWTGTGAFQLNSGTFRNELTGVFEVQNSAAITDADGAGTAALFENAGLFRKSVLTATTSFSGVAFNNTGEVAIETGVLSLQAGTSSGRFQAATGTTVIFAGGTHQLGDAASLTGDGLFRINAGVGSVLVNGDAGVDNLELLGGALSGPGALVVSNRFDWLGGSQGGAGSTVVSTQATFNLGGTASKTLNGRSVVNRGRALWSGTGNVLFNNGTFENQAGALFDIQNDRTMSDNDGGAAGQFYNAGVFRKSVATGVSVVSGVQLNNSGQVEVQRGSLLLGGGTSTGAFMADASAILGFNNGTHVLQNGATFQGDGSFRLTNGLPVLDIAGSVQAGSFELTSGTMTGAGTFTVSGTLHWRGGILSGSGSVEILPGATLRFGTGVGNQPILDGRTLNNHGTAVWADTVNLTFNQGTFNNLAGATFDILNDQGLYDNDSSSPVAVLNNAGRIQKTGSTGATLISGVRINNSGVIDVQGWTLNAYGALNNTGTCLVHAGTINVAADSLTAGLYLAETADALVSFQGSTQTFTNGAALAGPGTHQFNSSLVDIAADLGVNNLRLTGSNVRGSGTLMITNRLHLEYGSLSGPGTTWVLPAATAYITNGTPCTLNGATVRNQGHFVVADAIFSLRFPSGQFLNEPGAVLQLQREANITDDDGTATAAVLRNSGTIRVAAESATTTLGSIVFTNTGSVEVTSGTLMLAGPFHHAGLCALTNSTLRLGGDSVSLAPYTMGGGARLEFSSGTHQLNAGSGFSGPGAVAVTGGLLLVNSPVIAGNFQQAGGEVAGPASLTLTGASTWSGGKQSGSGSTVVGPNATLAVTGTVELDARTLGNQGQLSWQNSTVYFDAGLIDNAAGGFLELVNAGSLIDADGAATTPRVRNAGTFVVSGAGFADWTPASIENHGTLNVNQAWYVGPCAQFAGAINLTNGTFGATTLTLTGGSLNGTGSVISQHVRNSAQINVGNPVGMLFIRAPFEQTASGSLHLDVGGVAFGQSDILSVEQAVQLDGRLDITLVNNFVPTELDYVTAINGFPISGQFSSVTGGSVGGGKSLRPAYSATGVTLVLRDTTNQTSTIRFDPNPVRTGNEIQWTLSGTEGASFTVDISTNLTDWTLYLSVTNAASSVPLRVTNNPAIPYIYFRTKL